MYEVKRRAEPTDGATDWTANVNRWLTIPTGARERERVGGQEHGTGSAGSVVTIFDYDYLIQDGCLLIAGYSVVSIGHVCSMDSTRSDGGINVGVGGRAYLQPYAEGSALYYGSNPLTRAMRANAGGQVVAAQRPTERFERSFETRKRTGIDRRSQT